MPIDVQRRITHRVRSAVGPWIDRAARAVGQPVTHIRASEYAGTVRCRIDDLEAELSAAGFDWDPLSLYHYTPMGTSTDGSWVYRESPLADRQLHVVLFAQSVDRVDLYAHYEYNWLRHPVAHALQRDIRHEEGRRRMRGHLDRMDRDTYHESILHRKAAHLAELVDERFSVSLPL
ncbi:hypothetical protein [Halomicrobium urmianum]|uniref:hypothetical protein n=1 Tax=Halomicrobium urmianum TaxID=1586233 RepID=UPI001CD9636F|nr:hypothetical protein [Halomicrobium urmianum]